MPFLTVTDLYSHIYPEAVQEIERDVSTTNKLNEAIAAAVEEVKSYLSVYDLEAIFSATGNQRNPIICLYTKDIAVWHYIQLANPVIDLELRQARYDAAIKWLTKVQNGKVAPQLPLPEKEQGEEGEGFFKFGSNPKRNNHF